MKARTLERCQGVSCFYSATPASGAMIWRVVSMPSRLPRDAAILVLSQAQALNAFFMRISPSLFPLIGL
jgi:hypothetical protein